MSVRGSFEEEAFHLLCTNLSRGLLGHGASSSVPDPLLAEATLFQRGPGGSGR
jgi:hypothetical protein